MCNLSHLALQRVFFFFLNSKVLGSSVVAVVFSHSMSCCLHLPVLITDLGDTYLVNTLYVFKEYRYN